MSQIWFTADLHIGHAAIINYCNRPFTRGKCCNDKSCQECKGVGFIPDVEQMNETLIRNFNKKVQKSDHVYILGDLLFLSAAQTEEILGRLNGQKHIIFGNHDKELRKRKYSKYFASTSDLKEIKIEGQKIILCHYAMRTWNHSFKGSWHLYGHSHGRLTNPVDSLSMDVGVDLHDYMPVSFEEVRDLMTLKINFLDDLQESNSLVDLVLKFGSNFKNKNELSDVRKIVKKLGFSHDYIESKEENN